MAVDEVLDPAGGSDVVFVAVLGELEGGAELGVQFVGVVAHDRQAAAFGRAVGGEGATITWPPWRTAFITWRT